MYHKYTMLRAGQVYDPSQQQAIILVIKIDDGTLIALFSHLYTIVLVLLCLSSHLAHTAADLQCHVI
jgi:hypothetical protein